MPEKIRVTKAQYTPLAQEWAGKYWAAPVGPERDAVYKQLDGLSEKYEIIFEYEPNHKLVNVNEFIRLYCDDSERKDDKGATIYDGGGISGVYDDMNLRKLVLPNLKDWTFMDKWDNGYREVWHSPSNLIILTQCEGDLYVVLYDTEDDYKQALTEAAEYYKTY